MRDHEPSSTAILIALGFLILSSDGAYGRNKCPPGAPQVQLQLLRALFPHRYWFVLTLFQNRIIARCIRLLLALVIYPQVLEGVGVRKCFMEQHVRTSITDRGCRQVLVLAAGYDTLALRLAPEFPKVQFWELDHPATSGMKQKTLSTMAAAQRQQNKDSTASFKVPENLHLVPVDLSKRGSLQKALLGPKEPGQKQQQGTKTGRYDPAASTAVVMEGLLMYLTTDQVRELFANVASVTGGSNNKPQQGTSSICFDFFGWNETTQRADVGWLSTVLHWALARAGESWHFCIHPSKLPSFFADTLWRVVGPTQSVGWERLAAVEKVKEE